MKYTVYGIYKKSGEKVEVGTYDTLEEAEWNLAREIEVLKADGYAFETAEIVGYTESDVEDDVEEDYTMWDDEMLEDFRCHNEVLLSSLKLYLKRENSINRERAMEIYEAILIKQKEVVSEIFSRYIEF